MPLARTRNPLRFRRLGGAALAAAFLSSTAFAAAPAADPGADAYAAAQTAWKALKALPDESRKAHRHPWQDAIDKFKAVAEKYPKSALADDALFTEGTLYYDLYDAQAIHLKQDLESAIGAFKTCAKKYPGSNYADDSLFWEAKAEHLLGRHDDEAASLKTVLSKYPQGDMAKNANAQLAKIQADGEIEAQVAGGDRSASTRGGSSPSGDVERRETSGAQVAGGDRSASTRGGSSPSGAVVAVTATPAPAITAIAVATAAAVPSATPAGPKSGGTASAETVAVNAVKVWSNQDYTRIAIYTGAPCQWIAHDLKANGDLPPRVYLDLTKAKVGDTLKGAAAKMDNAWEVPIGDGLLTRARVAQNGPDTVRVVLDVASMDHYDIIQFDDPFRIIVDVSGTAAPSTTVAAVATPVSTAAIPVPTVTLTPDQVKLSGRIASQLGLKVTRIYVDAGHGGHDPGAVGPGGLREKDVTLAIAKLVRDDLKEAGYDPVLTRSDDTFLELDERTAIANQGRGDLFISIHCNSMDPTSKEHPSGVETYYAGLTSDKADQRLAAIENATTQEHMAGLSAVIESLMRSEFTNYSIELAAAVQSSVAGAVHKVNPGSHDYHVKTALFYVLLTARMPAVLVETSFISNKPDEKRLGDPKYQKTIAASIVSGVDSYIDANAMKSRLVEPAPSATPVKAEQATASSHGR